MIKDKIDNYDCKDLENMLKNMRLYPKMHASCKEAYLIRVSTILEIIDNYYLKPNHFYDKFLTKNGSMYTDLLSPIDQQWCSQLPPA